MLYELMGREVICESGVLSSTGITDEESDESGMLTFQL